MPSHNYIGLCIGNPRDDGSELKEPKDKAYRRLKIIPSDWNDAENGRIDNAEEISFAMATESWGKITHFAVFDSATAGNMLAYGKLVFHVYVHRTDIVKFLPGNLKIQL